MALAARYKGLRGGSRGLRHVEVLAPQEIDLDFIEHVVDIEEVYRVEEVLYVVLGLSVVLLGRCRILLISDLKVH